MRSLARTLLILLFLCLFLPYPAAAKTHDRIYAVANEAVKAHEAGDLHKALALYSQVIDSGQLGSGDRVLTYCYNNRAAIWLSQGEDDRAFLDLTKGIEYNPDYTAYYNRGTLFEERGRIDEALADYTKALEIFPGYGKALEARGHLLISRGQVNQGRSDLRKAQIARMKIRFF